MTNLNQEDWWAQSQEDPNAFILDVRTAAECEEGIVPGAAMIDIYKGQGFIYKVEELDKAKNYYVYCRAGSRSAQACEIMNQLGFENTFNLVGGFSQWKGAVVFPEVGQ